MMTRTVLLMVALSAVAVETSAFVVPLATKAIRSEFRVVASSQQPNLQGKVTVLSALETETKSRQADAVDDTTQIVSSSDDEKDESKNLFQKIKDAGVAGSISLFLWEGAFWAISVPLAIVGYQKVTGHWPDLSDKEDLAKVGAEAFAFANVARFALPLRIGLAVSTTPWVQANIVDKYLKKDEESS